MLTFDEARAKLLAAAEPLGAERVPLDLADGRVLAERIVAPEPLPRFDYSAMDGYAVRLADLEGDGPFELDVRGEIPAGGAIVELAPKSACRIFTGAPLARGADAIVMQEDVERAGDRMRFSAKPRSMQHVRRRGEDIDAGAVALDRGRRLEPGHVALAAALDAPTLLVARRPVLTVVGTGDELRAPGQPGRVGSIPESNGYFVAAAARRAGAIARMGAFIPDDRAKAETAVRDALAGTDVLVTIGGVSVGDHDVMRPAFEAAGVSIEFYKVAMKPGKPLTVGRHGRTIVLGLPGNPASASLSFLLFGVPLLRALQGDARPLPAPRAMTVASSVRRRPGRREFIRARAERRADQEVAVVLPNQASGAVTSFAQATHLIIAPEDHGDIEPGSKLDVLSIAEL